MVFFSVICLYVLVIFTVNEYYSVYDFLNSFISRLVFFFSLLSFILLIFGLVYYSLVLNTTQGVSGGYVVRTHYIIRRYVR